MAKKKRSIFLGPILVIIIMIIITALVSLIFSLMGINGDETTITGGTLGTTVISANNLISKEGIKHLFANVVVNFQQFEPLFLLIISLIGISIGEASGLFKAFFAPLHKIKLSIIIILTLMMGIMGNMLGPAAYALLIPLTAVVYKTIGRNPMLGIITMFLALTVGQAGGMIFSYDSYMFGQLTQKSAQVSVDKNFVFSMMSNIYIMFGSLFILVFIGRYIIEKYIVPKVPKYEISEEEKISTDELIISKTALRFSHLAFIVVLVIFTYMVVPGLPGSGILLASEGNTYLERLFSNDAALTQSLSWMVTIILMVCGGVYGFVSKNIHNIYEYNVALEKSFKHISYALVLFFFTSQLIEILDWTNVGKIIATKLIDFVSTISMTGLPLIVALFLIVVLIGLLIPSAMTKWQLMSPIVVPLLMRANLTPNFAQYIFMAADGISKSITPLFGYFILTIALLQKHNKGHANKITIFGILKLMMPAIILFIIVWLLILTGWFVIGIPLGTNTFPTL